MKSSVVLETSLQRLPAHLRGGISRYSPMNARRANDAHLDGKHIVDQRLAIRIRKRARAVTCEERAYTVVRGALLKLANGERVDGGGGSKNRDKS